MTDKEKFKIIKRGSASFSEEIHEGFPYWALSVFFPQLDEDNIERAIFDLDFNDESIDAFIVFDESKETHIFQFKSARSERQIRACKKEWLDYLFNVPIKLTNDTYIDNHKNDRIKDIAADYIIAKEKGYKIIFNFVHIGYIADEDLLLSYSSDENIIFNYFGIDEIVDMYEEYLSKTELTDPPSFEINLTYNNKPDIIEQKLGAHRTFISLITGDEVIRLREEHKYRLFDKNVRFNLGMNKVNSKIVDSATNSKEEFYFYNNGLTITCTKFKPRSNAVKVDFPQIINGAQTVDSIYQAYKIRFNKLKRMHRNIEEAKSQALEEFGRLKVLFRLIQKDEINPDFELNVIKSNNTQNAVQIRDFYSNNPEQIELQKFLSKHGYFYEIKRGERNYIKKETHLTLNKKLNDFEYKDDQIDIEKLASLFRAWNWEPSAKEVGAKRILNDDDTYHSIFGSSREDISDEKVKEMILAYNIFNIIESESKNYNKILKLLITIDDKKSDFNKVQQLVDDSLVFNKALKSKFESEDDYYRNKDRHKTAIRNSVAFSQGKYLVLATFSLIIHECSYLKTLTQETQLFKNKDFLKENIVKRWLPVILKRILNKEYERAIKDGVTQSAFYLRTKTFENMNKIFEQLEFNDEDDKEITEIFPLEIYQSA